MTSTNARIYISFFWVSSNYFWSPLKTWPLKKAMLSAGSMIWVMCNMILFETLSVLSVYLTHCTHPGHLYMTLTTPPAQYKFKGGINCALKWSLKNSIFSAGGVNFVTNPGCHFLCFTPSLICNTWFYVACYTILITSEFEMNFSI